MFHTTEEKKPATPPMTPEYANWVKKLNEGTIEEKKAAAAELGKIGTPDALDQLWRALGDREFDVRQATGDALYAAMKNNFVETFFKTLRFRRGPVRRGALEAIARNKIKSALYQIPKFRLLQDRYHIVKQAAIVAMGEIGTAQNASLLVPLARDENAYVRSAVMEAIGKLGDKSKADVLIAGLGDIHIEVQRKASSGLWALLLPDREPPRSLKSGVTPVLEPLVQLLKSQNETTRRLATFALGVVNDHAAIDPLIVLLKDASPRVRQAAAFSLGKLQDLTGTLPLIQALKDQDPMVRAAAAMGLGKIGDPQAVPVLLEQLVDKDRAVEKAVISALALLKDKRAVDALLQAVRSKDDAVREIAALGIKEIGDMETIHALIDDLKSNDRNIRRRVAEALGKVDNDEAIEPLITVLEKDSEPMVQSAAAVSLGEMRAGGAFDIFVRSLQEPNTTKSVRVACAQGLGLLQDTKAIPILLRYIMDASRDLRIAIAEAVRRLGGRTVVDTQMKRLLGGSDTEKEEAKNILGALGDPRAILPLLTQFQGADAPLKASIATILSELRNVGTVDNLAGAIASADEQVKADGDEIHRGLKDPETTTILLQLCKSEIALIREISAYYLGVFGDATVLPNLEELLKDEDPAVQQATQKAIESLKEPV